MAVGASLWGNCNWNSGHADVNINQYNNYTKNVNTSTTANQRIQSAGSTGQGGRQVEWKHNAERRGAVPYRKARISDSSRPTKRRRRSCKLPGRMTPQRWFGSWGRTASASFRPVTPSATGEHENGSSSCTTRPAGSSPSQRPKPSSIWARTTGRCHSSREGRQGGGDENALQPSTPAELPGDPDRPEIVVGAVVDAGAAVELDRLMAAQG